MGFSDIPIDIRLQIYSELLILPTPIEFIADYGPPPPPLFRSQKDGLHPAILRVSRAVYNEASPLLYSNNRFRFPEISWYGSPVEGHAYLAPFLTQIKSQARLIRHISIPFPTFGYPVPVRARLHQVHIENLELLKKTCTGIRTLELRIPPEHHNYALSEQPIAMEALKILDTELRTIVSIKEIVVNFEEYPGDEPDEDLKKKMRDMGWTVTITKLPRRVWISADDRVEFDNEEDCIAYDRVLLEEEMQREEKKAEKEWLEEYYRRRRDPYWKNDSDYD